MTSAKKSDDDQDDAVGGDIGKAIQDAFKNGGKPKEMFGKFVGKMKDMMEKGKNGKDANRGGMWMKKMKETMDKFKSLSTMEGTDEEKMAKAKEIFKSMMPGKGGKNKDFQNGMSMFKKFGKNKKE